MKELLNKPLWWWFAFITVIFHNFAVFSAAGRAFTVSDILVVTAVIAMIFTGSFDKKRLFTSLGLILILPVLSFLISIDLKESVTTFMPLLLYGFFFSLYFSSMTIDRENLVKGFLTAMVLIVIFGVLQYSLVRTKTVLDRWIVYPFGDRTAFGFGLFQGLRSVRWRPNSIFWEPSMLGLFSVVAFYLDYSLDKKITWRKIIYIIGLIISFSTAAYFTFAVCLASVLIPRTKSGMQKFVVLIVLAVPVAALIFSSSPRLINVFNRLAEFGRPHSSGYARISAPFQAALHVLTERPLGVGIGAGDIYLQRLAPVNLSNLFAGDRAIHNSFVLPVVWYGFGSIVYLVWLTGLFVRGFRAHRTYLVLLLTLFLLGTGALTMFVNWYFFALIFPLIYAENENTLDN